MCAVSREMPYNHMPDLYRNEQCGININQELSIYIPQVDQEYATEEYMRNIFKNLNIGEVKSAYFEERQDKDGWHCVIYMKNWYRSTMVQNLQENISDPEKDACLIYDDPNYWLLHENDVNLYTTEYNLTGLQALVTLQTKQIKILEEKNSVLENTLGDMNWRINLHDANIEYLSKIVRPLAVQQKKTTSNYKQSVKNLYHNNSCCGAASDAWVPSYPSVVKDTIWKERLHSRTDNRSTYM